MSDELHVTETDTEIIVEFRADGGTASEVLRIDKATFGVPEADTPAIVPAKEPIE